MLIVCPSCTTSYMVDPGSLGPAGRMVRCARCKTAWLAGGPNARAEVSGYAETGIAEAGGRTAAPATPATHNSSPPDDFADDDFGAEPTTPAGQHRGRAAAEATAYAPHARGPFAISDAPSLIPPNGHEPPPSRRKNPEVEDVESFTARRARMQAKQKTKRRSSKWAALILVLFGFNVALVGARNEVVRFMPQTASLFAAIGLPVNLRHLTFENVKISKEENDGVNVLVVEGTIVSDAGKAVEVPRMRFAVRNATGQEIYSWTALPSRSILGPNETLPFRSRLASPPADASDVVVRFFTAGDAVPETK